MESSLLSSGHSYAGTRLSSTHTLAGAIGEVTGGVTYLNTLRQLLDTAENDFPTLQRRLEEMRKVLLTKESMIINLTGDDNTLNMSNKSVTQFLNKLPLSGSSQTCMLGQWKDDVKLKMEPKNEGFSVPTQVNYVGKGGRVYMPGELVSGSSMVISRALRSGYLWDTVRVMGGAYGGFCRFSPLTGTFAYLSYRDPNLLKTVSNYDGSAQHLKSTVLSDEALEQV